MKTAAKLLVAGLLTLSAVALANDNDRPEVPPNVVFILADDVGYGDIGAYGGRIATPNIDSLARQGMRFTDAHSAAALCAPSRFSLLTGSYPYRNGRPGGSWDINFSSGFQAGSEHLAASRHVTVAEVLQGAGYTTGFVGKMHVGGNVFDQSGQLIREKNRLNEMDFARGINDGLNQHGFDYVFGLPSGIQHEPYAYFENGSYKPVAEEDVADNSSTVLRVSGRYAIGDNGTSEIVEADMIPARADRNYDSSQVGPTLTDKAVEFIEQHAAERAPFALCFSSQAIHVPHTPPKDFDGDPSELQRPVAGTTGGATSDMLVELDLQVGTLLDALRRSGVLQDTLVIFTSDNGALAPNVADYGDNTHDNNGPWRGYKASVYEGGHRVPLIMRWGDGTTTGSYIPPGSVAEQTVVNHDWVATVYDLLDQPMSSDQAMDSATLVPILLDGSEAPIHDFVIYQAGNASVGAIRDDEWVLVVDAEERPSELYNLADDPQQRDNLIGRTDKAALVAELRATFLEHHDRDSSTFEEPRTTPVVVSDSLLYASDEFELYDDRVVQSEFVAQAESARRISSTYPRAAHEVMFKFSVNGTENEFPPGKDQMIHLRPVDGEIHTPTYRFGHLYPVSLPQPRATATSEEGPVDVTFRLDMRDVLAEFDAHGSYKPPNGDVIAAEDFHGVYIMGNTAPLNWDMSSLRPGSDRQLHDDDGDGIYELTLTFDAQYNRTLDDKGRAVWTLQEDLSDFPTYKSDQPIVDAIHNLSLEELLQLTREDGGIVAGARWPDVWTRDLAWGAILAAAAVAPEAVQKSLLLKVDDKGRIVQDLGTGGSWPVSTDRVAWTVAAWEVYVVTGDRDWLQQAYEIAQRSAKADLHAAYDVRTGLFYGESSFLDWREQSYPRWMQAADIYQSQSLGTNALHYASWRILARMAESLGEPAHQYQAVADAVQTGMNQHLWQAEAGYHGQFIYGRTYRLLSPRAEALGEAFANLFGVSNNKQRALSVASLPVVSFGVPSFWPYSADVPPYHNAGIWPQVGGFWTWAAAEAGNSAAVEHGLATLYRAAALFLTNKENMVAETGHFEGTELNSDRLIGSVGASLATVYRVLLGMRFHEDRLEFRPFVPRAYDGRRELHGFRYRAARLDIEITGYGDAAASVYLDGKLLPGTSIPGNLRGKHHLRITMNGDLGSGSINLVENLAAPAVPEAKIVGPSLLWDAVVDAEEYVVYRNGEPVLRTRTRQVPVHADGDLTTYQIAAISAAGAESFLSAPMRVIEPAGTLTFDGEKPDGVLVTPSENSIVDFRVTVEESACYAADVQYANGNGPVNSGNSAALRSLLVDGVRVGALVMPHRGKRDWKSRGYSNPLQLYLTAGTHTLTLALTDLDENMSVELNDARLYHLRLTRVESNSHCLSDTASSIARVGGRQAVSLNAGWLFALQDGDDTPDHARSQAIDLPHTWNTTDAADKSKPYHRGVGHYQRTLFVPEAMRGRTLYLYFEAANQVADVSINGVAVGRHVGGYSAFAVDMSDSIKFGEDNVIDVRVSNEHNAEVPPLNADFTFYGGIYRDVWLLSLDDVHINIDDYAATELVIDTVDVSRSKATVSVKGAITNRHGGPRKVDVETKLVDANGAVVATSSVTAKLAAGKNIPQALAAFTILDPQLWSPESPYLYRVVTTIRDGELLLDEVQFPLGFRWFAVDSESGFELNGEPYRLYGTNRHQDYPVLGNALPNGLHRRDLEIVKENGFNFLRLAHYPQDPAVLQAADEIGLLLWEETPIVNLIDQSDGFRDNSVRMVREMIRQHRHHPSIAFWGYMNEVMLREPNPAPDNYREDLLELAAELDDVVKQEDVSRPTVMALSRDEIDNGVPLWEISDVLAFNLYFGWYYEDFAALGEFLDNYRAAHPETPLMVSEYGAGSDERVHSLHPVSFDFSTELQQRFHEENFRQILARPWLIGSAVWNQFDFGSNHRQDTKFAINQKGLWYFNRTPKDIAAYYKAQLVKDPFVHIATRDWPRRAGSRPEDSMMPIQVYSNVDDVELLVNDESLGKQSLKNAVAQWMVKFRAGENRLVARAANAEDRHTVVYIERTSMFASNEPVELAVNSGGNEQIVDTAGLVWEADRRYSEGSWGYVGGSAERQHQRILNTEEDPLYQTRRNGAHDYRFDVPAGHYELQFHLADLDDENGAFLVEVNGSAQRIDISDSFTGTVVQHDLAVDGHAGIELSFRNDSNSAFVNGLLLRRVAAP